jgi:hypothetical protein
MNKTLLLILCDFLLLTLLSLVNWEEEKKSDDTPPAESGEHSVSAMAMMEQDLLDTLKASLEEEQVAQEQLQDKTARSQKELEEAEKLIDERNASIDGLRDDLELASARENTLVEEKKTLLDGTNQAKESIFVLESKYQSLETKAKQTEAQARLLQEELDDKLKQIKQKEEALKQEQVAKKEAEGRIQELNIQVRVSDEQKRILQENVDTLKGEVIAERTERKELQAQTTQMAEGITQLAERSQDLTEEFRSSLPVNANTLFSKFNASRIVTMFASNRYYRGQNLQDEERAMTILVSDGESIYALSHLSSTPLGLSKSTLGYREVRAELVRGEARLVPSVLEFLALDPRIAATRISKEEADSLGGELFYTALEPFKFSEAILIDEKGDYYGEVEFKLTANTPGYVRMQSKVFSRIFGDFSPTKGDLVFSKTGELLGLMVDNRYCALINNLLNEESLSLGESFDRDEFKNIVSSLRYRYEQLPEELR